MRYRQGVYLIIKQDNKFLLANNASLNEGHSIPGGGIDDGETPTEAFYR